MATRSRRVEIDRVEVEKSCRKETKNMSVNRYNNIVTISPEASIGDAIATLINTSSFVLQVAGEGDKPAGWLDYLDILKIFQGDPDAAPIRSRKVKDYIHMIGNEDYLEVEQELAGIKTWLQDRAKKLPYFISQDKQSSGVLSLEGLLAEALEKHTQEQERRLEIEDLFGIVIAEAPVGLAFISPAGDIKYLNPLAAHILEITRLNASDLINIAVKNETKIIRTNGRSYKVWGIKSGKEKAPGYLAIFVDITNEQDLFEKVKHAQLEAELALATLLPDQRVEARLRSIVEYMDEYDAGTGKIKVTGVIREGVYRHVINILRLVAELSKQGLTELPGVDKETVVKAAIFHDLAKVQPYLQPGDVVDPRESFEPGYLHAFRSASLAKGIYNIDDKTVSIIKYHHHEEHDLPEDYPLYLLPMYRLFRLLDGLSAGITRRGSRVKLTASGTLVHVREESSFPLYNRHFELDLYSGRTGIKPLL
ncbi:HD domain-containing protein [Moorella sulfitireducens]|uniref:HD domain-containing protein n=1 Tax=Neomoorella sulfitireducens TaxID=2972948 RepID=UPI0021AC93AF|nr:HD domain-containing protein [Moorella sulfitireducens]